MQVISGRIEKAKKVVLYGPEGVGKSSFSSNFPRPIFIDTEGSTTELVVDRLARPSSWELLLQQVDWVKKSDYKTLVIDTVDWAEMLCTQAVCAKHNKAGVESFGYGEGYTFVSEEFGKFLNKLSDLIEIGINVVLNAHSQIRKFDQPDEMGSYDRYQLKLGKKTTSQTAPLVKEWADMVLFMNYKTFSVATDDKGKKHVGQGGVRTIYATHHPAWDAKNRHGLPDEFPMDYAQIAHIFNAVPQASVVQAPPIAPPVQQQMAPTVQQPVPPAPAVAAEPPQAPTQQQAPTLAVPNDINPAIPQSLRDLMMQHQVTEAEIQLVVSTKGYYPAGTPILNYDPGFIEGVLVAAWNQVYEMVVTDRGLPF